MSKRCGRCFALWADCKCFTDDPVWDARTLRQERDTARALVGQYAERILEMTGALVVAELALGFYADPENHEQKRRDIFVGSEVHFDAGQRAREALAKAEALGRKDG